MNLFRKRQLKDLNERLVKASKLSELLKRPSGGWIKSIRTALGMPSVVLAKKLNVSKSRITDLEKKEIIDVATIKSLKNVAEALDCEFVYGFIPKNGLLEYKREHARRFAKNIVQRSHQHMVLEDQQLDSQKLEEMIQELTEEYLLTDKKEIWNV